MRRFAISHVFGALAIVRRSFSLAIVTCFLAILWANAAQAVFDYNTVGGSYTQNFDSLPSTPTNTNIQTATFTHGWQDDTSTVAGDHVSIPDWYLYHDASQAEGGTNGHQRLRFSTGNNNTGSFYSFGVAGTNPVTDRALGNITSSTIGTSYYGVRLRNTTGVALSTFTLQYAGEQWRDADTTAQTVTFSYAVTDSTPTDVGIFNATSNAGGIPSANITSVASLNFTSLKNTSTAGVAIDGNAAANRSVISATLLGLSWAPGQDIWLRWTDIDHTNSDHGMAIDDLSFSANVMPTSSWTGTTDSDWNKSSNWSAGVPGSGAIATFDGAGDSNTTIGLGGTRPVGIVQFNAGAAAYTLGTSSEQFDIDNGGAIKMASGVTNSQAINAKINALGGVTIANSSTTNGLTIGSTVTSSNNSVAVDGAGAVTFNAPIVTSNSSVSANGSGTITFNGAISGTGSTLTSNSTGTLVISAQNTYTGATAINATVQNVVRLGVSSVGAPGSITSGPFGTGAVSVSGSTSPILQPINSDITVANDLSLGAGFFAATAPAAVDPTVRSLTFTGNITPAGNRTITNNIVAGGTLTLGSSGSPSTLALAGNTLGFQTQPSSGVGGGKIVINDLITGSAAVTATQLTVQNGVSVELKNANTYTGLTTLQIGSGGVGNPTLLVNNTTGSGTGTGQVNVKIGFLGGTGTIAPTAPVTAAIPGQVTIGNAASGSAGVLAPGSGGIGTLTFDSSASANGPILDFVANGSMLAELNNSHQSDKVSVIGAAAGDVLFNSTVVNFTDLTSGNTLASGNYTLFTTDLVGAYSGLTFDGTDPTKIISGLTIGTGLGTYADTSLHSANGGKDIVLTIAGATLAGDYNADGKVDAADYVIWRKGGSPNPNSPTDYNAWRANFGAGAPGSGSGALANGSSVPEPASVLLVLLGLAALTGSRRVSR
jgi:autotransporter-associated beta strand protein